MGIVFACGFPLLKKEKQKMYENQIKVNFQNNKEYGSHCFRLNYSSSHKRTEYLNGKKHTVVSATMLIANEVFNGNQGGWYYPAGAVARSVQAWNSKPVTCPGHPVDEDGNFVSASATPAIFNKFAVGTIFNASFNNDVLKADLWLENSKCQEIFKVLEQGHSMDVSTGMFSEDVLNLGNGAIQGSVQVILPDHLALLPNAVGACSWEDGCGIRNENPPQRYSSTGDDYTFANLKQNQNHGEVQPMDDPSFYGDLDRDIEKGQRNNQNNDEVQPLPDPTDYEN